MASVKSSSAAKAAPPVTAATAARASPAASRSVQRRPETVARLAQRGDLGHVQRRAVAPDQIEAYLARRPCSFSPAGVSQAMTRPRSSTATRSRTVSASMTLWVTSRTVVPCSARRRSTAAQTARRATRVHPGRRLVEHEQGPLPDQRRREAGQPALPAGELLQRAVRRERRDPARRGRRPARRGPRGASSPRSRAVVSAASATVSSSRAVDS